MKRRAGLVLPLAIAVVLGFVAVCVRYAPTTRLLRLVRTATGTSTLDRELDAKLLGRRVPAITIRSAGGEVTDLASLVPPPALVVFHSELCSHCEDLRSALESKRAAGELGPLHLVLIRVDSTVHAGTSSDAVDAAQATALSEGWLWGSLLPGEENLTIRSVYGLFTMPAIWLIDANNTVISRMTGFAKYRLDRQIRGLLRTVGKSPR